MRLPYSKEVSQGFLKILVSKWPSSPFWKRIPGTFWLGERNEILRELIATQYQSVFGAAPDDAGLEFWTARIANGELALNELWETLLMDPEVRGRWEF